MRFAAHVYLSIGCGLLTIPVTLALVDNPTSPEIPAACVDVPNPSPEYDRCWREDYAR